MDEGKASSQVPNMAGLFLLFIGLQMGEQQIREWEQAMEVCKSNGDP